MRRLNYIQPLKLLIFILFYVTPYQGSAFTDQGTDNLRNSIEEKLDLGNPSAYNIARIWHLSTKDLICEACSRLGCNLTSEEWRAQYCQGCKDVGVGGA